ncbi:MAG: pentapeptide repeat-containing protein [Chloroflexota bacterium]
MSITNILQDKARESADARKKLGDIITLEGFTQTIVIIAVLVAIVGYINQHGWLLNATNVLGDFYANVSSELLSIIVTVLVLERLNARRQDEQEKRRLIALLGSNEAVVTKIAIAELRARGWLEDGTLAGIDLIRANLEGAYLRGADLRKADLRRANFTKADLYHATLSNAGLFRANLTKAKLNNIDLRNSELKRANLSGANLFGANLRSSILENANLSNTLLWNVNLSNANLKNADLTDAIFDETILPDKTVWTPDTDMTRFTNPEHPDFWSPEDN